jgi:hypothetical protein
MAGTIREAFIYLIRLVHLVHITYCSGRGSTTA